eukprot:2877539-Prymnesium_polylepis.1
MLVAAAPSITMLTCLVSCEHATASNAAARHPLRVCASGQSWSFDSPIASALPFGRRPVFGV